MGLQDCGVRISPISQPKSMDDVMQRSVNNNKQETDAFGEAPNSRRSYTKTATNSAKIITDSA